MENLATKPRGKKDSEVVLRVNTRLKEAREKKDISAAALAQQVGLSVSTINHYEQHRRKIDVETLDKIAEALDVTPLYFFIPTEKELRELDRKIHQLTTEYQELEKKRIESNLLDSKLYEACKQKYEEILKLEKRRKYLKSLMEINNVIGQKLH